MTCLTSLAPWYTNSGRAHCRWLNWRLWTQDVLAGARRIYLASGFTLLAEQPHHSFGADLVAQTYEAELGRPTEPAG